MRTIKTVGVFLAFFFASNYSAFSAEKDEVPLGDYKNIDARVKKLEAIIESQENRNNVQPTKESKASQVPQETFLSRDNIPTLPSNDFEVSDTVEYGRSTSYSQNDRIFLNTTRFRYGIAHDFELALSVPYFYAQRQSPLYDHTVIHNNSGFTDISIQASKNLWLEGEWYPGAAVTLGMSIPVGNAPYDQNNLKAGGNPTDPLSLNLSTGHWVPRGAIQFFKTVDPLILFFGIGTDYSIPKTFNGVKIEPGHRITYNMGLGFAVSERSTLGISFNGAIADRIKVGGISVANSNYELLTSTLTLIQRVGQDFWIEPAVTFGLTDDAPDIAFALSLRKRF